MVISEAFALRPHTTSREPLMRIKFWNTPRRAIVSSALLLTTGVILIASTMQPPNDPTRWDWLEGTTWFVRPQGLPNMIYRAENDSVSPSFDQTVYQIESCRYGYFEGHTTIQLTGAAVQCRRLIGSITPEGQVQLTFFALDNGTVTSAINAVGAMRHVQGQWTMQNQMAAPMTGDQSGFAVHWANMFQVREGEHFWNRLPMVDMSVPEFMAQCYPRE